MLDATERKTLAWCTFITGVLCLIPGETPRGPRVLDYTIQVFGRVLEHHATQGAWAICAVIVVYHLWRTRKDAQPEAPAASKVEAG
jgi:hypothetical protein